MLNIRLLFLILALGFVSSEIIAQEDELGTIVLWRSGEYNHPKLRNRVAINGMLFSNLSKRNYVRLDLPPGEYVLEVGHIELQSDKDPDGKWFHPDESGVFKVNLKAGVTYNIEGRMKRMDAEMDTTITDDRLRYYVDMQRYRGSYNFLKTQLEARTLTRNKDYLYSKVEIVTQNGKKKKAVILPSASDSYTFMELEVGYLYEQTISRSQVRSIQRLVE